MKVEDLARDLKRQFSGSVANNFLAPIGGRQPHGSLTTCCVVRNYLQHYPLKANEPDWLCKKNTPEGEPGPDSPRVFYIFDCRYKGQQTNQVFGSIYVLNSKQDAAKMLDRSQMTLQINESKPQYGIGEQAYGYAGHGSAWITFRNGNLFGQVNVGLIDPRTLADPSPEMDAFTRQVFDIAMRFALYLAQYAPAT